MNNTRRYCAVMADGGLLCIPCAASENGSHAGTEKWSPGRGGPLDSQCPDDCQWIIIGIQQWNEENARCDHCGECFSAVQYDRTKGG